MSRGVLARGDLNYRIETSQFSGNFQACISN